MDDRELCAEEALMDALMFGGPATTWKVPEGATIEPNPEPEQLTRVMISWVA